MKRKTIGIILIVTPIIALPLVLVTYAIVNFTSGTMVDEISNNDQIVNGLEQSVDQVETEKNISSEPLKQSSLADDILTDNTDNVQLKEDVLIAENCNAFPNKLSECTKYKCQFVNPFTNSKMQKEITGIIGNKCNAVEQMPNNGKMECNFTLSQRTVAAQYYKDVLLADSAGTSVNLDSSNGQKTTYTLDGQEVENPLQTFITDGTCLISGY